MVHANIYKLYLLHSHARNSLINQVIINYYHYKDLQNFFSFLIMATHNGKVTALTLLDLSAAFDTIDQDILITRLSTWYGISGTALSWFTSYLTDRRQAIKIGNCFSDMLPTSCGDPRVLFWVRCFSLCTQHH